MAISTAALVLLSAPLAVIAAIVRMTSPGPVFYTQERMGLDGKPFLVYKFRSMFHDAERETGPVWAREDDPRRTPMGKLLRRFSLDELPQLWNVVKGEMWRGNTSIEKRIEYDLYYIENWSVMLDLKIMWLTLVKGVFHKHAY
jgi:lipopolysaccharide/colanic/teichoic acid biosynthesis glycosyltransferase